MNLVTVICVTPTYEELTLKKHACLLGT